MNVIGVLRQLGGVASRAAILAAGVTAWELGAACHAGTVIRIRRAWYALPGADPAVAAAVRVGGMLTCTSLLRSEGVWAPGSGEDLHVSVAANASRLRSARSRRVPLTVEPDGVVLHWRRRDGATSVARDSIVGALHELGDCADREGMIAAIDSALHLGRLSTAELDAMELPRAIRTKVDGRAESGGETAVRLRLRALRIGHRLQAPIPGVGRVDFLVGDRLVIEVDGYAVHGTREAFERDRRRDAELVAQGFLVLRLSYRQIADEWPRIERTILAIVRSDRHRRLPQAA